MKMKDGGWVIFRVQDWMGRCGMEGVVLGFVRIYASLPLHNRVSKASEVALQAMLFHPYKLLHEELDSPYHFEVLQVHFF